MTPERIKPVEAVRQGEPAGRRLVLVGSQSTREELLYARLLPVVTRLIWTFAGADPDRDDLVQDIFVRIFRGSARIRDPERIEAWAVRVTMNSVKNEFRRRKLRRWFALDASRDAEPRCHPDFDGREVLRRTYGVLERLPTTERLVLSLRLFEEASIERIAAVCGGSERTAKRRLKSARERFVRMAERDPLLRPRVAGTPRDDDG
jgi:RNA polymerase sigma-70 factor (ECF subfamily)